MLPTFQSKIISACNTVRPINACPLLTDNIRRSTMINAIILNLGICVAVFVLLVLISKQPADKGRGRTDFTFIMPLAPWSHALAMFLNFSLLARALHSAWLEIILWICIGKYIVQIQYANSRI